MEVDRFKHRQLAPTVGPSSRSSGEFEGPRDQLQSTRRCVFVDQIDNSPCSSQDGSNSMLRPPLLRCLSHIGENLLQIQLDESSVQGKRRWKPCRFGTRLQRFRNRARAEHRVPARTVRQQFQIVVIMHAYQRPFQSSIQLWSCATHASCISNQCSKQNFGALCYVHTRAAPQSLQAQHLLSTRRSHGGKQQVLSTPRFFASCTRQDSAEALRQPRRAPRVLVSRPQRLYIDYAVRRRDVVFWVYDYLDYSPRLVSTRKLVEDGSRDINN
jgi:hypothetical protein